MQHSQNFNIHCLLFNLLPNIHLSGINESSSILNKYP